MRRTLTLVAALALAFVLAGCNSDTAVSDVSTATTDLDTEAVKSTLDGIDVGEPTDADIASMLQMREEEKLARDVYLTLGEQWGVVVFARIATSEQMHMDAMALLLDRYGLEDPVGEDVRGQFVDEKLQALYDTLVAQGSASVEAALRVGAAIEEIDIIDLDEEIATTSLDDVRYVYERLEFASGNHLRAFVRQLQALGVAYEPQYLDQETYDTILASRPGHGGNGRGRRGGWGR